MKIIVIGGSNSRLKNGWVKRLQDMVPDIQIVNRSIGAATSTMGYFQLQGFDGIAPGDIVFWEYALNDESQVGKDRVTTDFTLRYMELCMRKSLAQGAAFVPLVFRQKPMRDSKTPSDYFSGLAFLFATYGITPVDANALWCAKHGGTEVPARQYKNRLHYQTDAEVMDMIVDECLSRLSASAPVALPAVPVHGLDVDDVAYLTVATGGKDLAFANSAIQLTLHQPDASPLPASILQAVPEGTWRLAGNICLRNKTAAYYILTADNKTARFRVFHNRVEFDKAILSWVAIKAEEPILVSSQSEVRLLRKATGEVEQPAAVNQGFVALHLERVVAGA